MSDWEYGFLVGYICGMLVGAGVLLQILSLVKDWRHP